MQEKNQGDEKLKNYSKLLDSQLRILKIKYKGYSLGFEVGYIYTLFILLYVLSFISFVKFINPSTIWIIILTSLLLLGSLWYGSVIVYYANKYLMRRFRS